MIQKRQRIVLKRIHSSVLAHKFLGPEFIPQDDLNKVAQDLSTIKDKMSDRATELRASLVFSCTHDSHGYWCLEGIGHKMRAVIPVLSERNIDIKSHASLFLQDTQIMTAKHAASLGGTSLNEFTKQELKVCKCDNCTQKSPLIEGMHRRLSDVMLSLDL